MNEGDDCFGETRLAHLVQEHAHLPSDQLRERVLREVKIAVHPDDADDARRIIESHLTEKRTGQVVRLRDEFETLQRAIDYRFHDRGLLEHAMTHTSRANEDVSGGVVDNESLEFLGDALLGFVVADVLFREFPEYDEGEKSKTKASIVSTTA